MGCDENQQDPSIIVMKFGGASLATPEQFDSIAGLIVRRSKTVDKLVIVVSAMGKTTDDLIALAHTVNATPPQREYDMLLSVGERISMSLLAMALAKKGVSALSLTGSQSGIITCTTHREARIVDIRPKRIISALEKKHIVIVAGFQGVSLDGEITTLGRGGSDTSAVALGIALNAAVIEFYKDVPGFFTHDPKLYPDAELLRELSYDTALEVLEHGGRILHPRAVLMAKRHNIPLAILPFDETPYLHLKDAHFGLQSRIYDAFRSREEEKTYERIHIDPSLQLLLSSS